MEGEPAPPDPSDDEGVGASASIRGRGASANARVKSEEDELAVRRGKGAGGDDGFARGEGGGEEEEKDGTIVPADAEIRPGGRTRTRTRIDRRKVGRHRGGAAEGARARRGERSKPARGTARGSPRRVSVSKRRRRGEGILRAIRRGRRHVRRQGWRSAMANEAAANQADGGTTSDGSHVVVGRRGGSPLWRGGEMASRVWRRDPPETTTNATTGRRTTRTGTRMIAMRWRPSEGSPWAGNPWAGSPSRTLGRRRYHLGRFPRRMTTASSTWG